MALPAHWNADEAVDDPERWLGSSPLLDLEDPTRVLRRLPNWILAPLEPYERTGDVPNVVFPCGLVHDPKTDQLRLYYGAADSSICLATARLDELLDAVLAAPRDGA